LFSEWCQICDHPVMGASMYGHYILQLQQNRLLRGDDLMDRFFFCLTVIRVLMFHISIYTCDMEF
jgi:CCR4-NOT transcription complex subunit 1